MIFKLTEVHPIFEYLQTQGPLKYVDTRVYGAGGWFYDCHASLVLQPELVPLLYGQTRITVILPESEKIDFVNYLTYCYTGRYVKLGFGLI